MRVSVVEERFDAWACIAEQQRLAPQTPGANGASCAFVGTMRDFNAGVAVEAMTLEHYPGMTERQLERIGQQALSRWALSDVFIQHRVGRILPGEDIVAIAVWAAHRAESFAACRFIIEELKSRAPFWKRERVPDGERWVSKNTPATV